MCPDTPKLLPLLAAERGSEVQCGARLRRALISSHPACGQILNRSRGFITPHISPGVAAVPQQSHSSFCRHSHQGELTQQFRREMQTDFCGACPDPQNDSRAGVTQQRHINAGDVGLTGSDSPPSISQSTTKALGLAGD